MTLSDLLYLCALLAVAVGAAILVGVFLGVVAAIGAAFVALGVSLFLCARAAAAEGGQ